MQYTIQDSDHEHIKVIKQALNKFGETSQVTKALEEFAELQCELARHLNKKGCKIKIAEEIADCKIMLAQLELIFNEKDVTFFLQRKLARLHNFVQNQNKDE